MRQMRPVASWISQIKTPSRFGFGASGEKEAPEAQAWGRNQRRTPTALDPPNQSICIDSVIHRLVLGVEDTQPEHSRPARIPRKRGGVVPAAIAPDQIPVLVVDVQVDVAVSDDGCARALSGLEHDAVGVSIASENNLIRALGTAESTCQGDPAGNGSEDGDDTEQDDAASKTRCFADAAHLVQIPVKAESNADKNAIEVGIKSALPVTEQGNRKFRF